MKRIMDLGLVVLSLPLWGPLFLLVWLVVRIGLGAPAFFHQRRAGLNGKPFTIIKFRTMTDHRDAAGNLLPDAARLTRCGHLLRNLSLDELPELLNVLRGEMSLVGPRPLPVLYLDRYTPEQARRHEVPPGLTGWAQVNGRNAVDWETRFQMDVWYVDNRSFWLDLRILGKTLLTVLSRKGIAAENSATMHEFMGSGQDSGDKRPPA
jgi:lipopolysaccharide/colanic/teichoic acid biosynthesis glycosyltransferase